MANLTLDAGEREKLRMWDAQHLARFHHAREPRGGAIGGRLTFELTRTSIGMVVQVRCCFPKCREDVGDLTDYESF